MSWLTRIERHDEVDSTMKLALEAAEAGKPPGTTVIAKSQNAGRGRRGRSWYSPAEAGLWMTTMLHPHPNRPSHTLSLVAGGALWTALRQLGCSEVQLKWPNDVEAQNRKLAGILLEHTQLKARPDESVVLIGIGLNLTARSNLELPEELEERYIGLDELVPDTPYERVLQEVVGQLEAATSAWARDGLGPTFALWDQADALAGQSVSATGPDGPIEGIAQGLAPGGQLRLQTATGEVLIDAGEVSRIQRRA